MTAIALLVLGGAAWYFTTAEERLRLWRGTLSLLLQLKKKVDLHRQEPEPFLDALRARAAMPFVTIGLVGIHILAFAFIIVGGAAFSDPEGLVGWGGNFGPRTTNGEWWRLISAMFLHGGVLSLLVNMAALAQIGFLLERLVGRLALVVVYLGAGIVAGLVDLFMQPMTVSVGASAAVFSLYGLLGASAIWMLRRRSDTAPSLKAARRLLPVAAVFILYHVLTGELGTAGMRTGLVLGLVAGAFLSRESIERHPPASRVCAVGGLALVIAIAAAIPLRGIADVRPVGAAHALKIQGQKRVVACFFGDGAINRGPFLEALNWAAVHALPVLFVCEDNRWSATTPTDAMTAGEGALARAEAIGVPGEQVDGNDVFAVDAAAQRLIAEDAGGKGPRFLHAMTYRFKGHVSVDAAAYRDGAEVSKALRERSARARGAEDLRSREARSDLDRRRRQEVQRALRARPHAAPWPEARGAYTDVQDTGGGQWR